MAKVKEGHLLKICFKYVGDFLGFFANMCALFLICDRLEFCSCVHRHGNDDPNAPVEIDEIVKVGMRNQNLCNFLAG